jgi:molybdopterin/thiamine biosynthesis adenylyltransferase
MQEIGERLRALAVETTDARGERFCVICLARMREAAEKTGLSGREAEIAALRERVLPERYMRNLGTVGWEGQIALLQSTVGIIGAGGLGGWIIEGLARMGVGRLIIVDSDVFEENNLNRQAFCREGNLGQPKVEAARQRVAEVNAAVQVVTHQVRVDEPQKMVELLSGADVLVDALDALPTRLTLQQAAREVSVPLVHGAIAGYVGQVMTIFPDDPGLLGLYGEGPVPEHGIEVQWGNPAATPMMVAAWQIQEVVKLLTGRGEPLRRRMLFMDSEIGAIDILRV